MKKSQLRKTIRESIKQLLTESQDPGILIVAMPNVPGYSSNSQCVGWQLSGWYNACCYFQNIWNPGTSTIDSVDGNGTNVFAYFGIPVNGTVPCFQNCNISQWGQGGDPYLPYITPNELTTFIGQYGTLNNTIYNSTSTFPTGNFQGLFYQPPSPYFGVNHTACHQWVQSNQSSCDTTPASACATQWFANPAQPWAVSFMASNDCQSYPWAANNLEPQANTIMAAAPTPQPGPYNDWNDIKNAANASGLVMPQKGQFKRKMAKAMYSQCQITACAC